MQIYQKSVKIDCPVEKAFDFHCDTNNLTLITPPGIKVAILKIDLPLKLNSEIILRVNQFGVLKNKWHLRITEFVENEIITDTQIAGPFRHWVHRHMFSSSGNTTVMTDEIDYELAFGPLGSIVSKLVLPSLIGKQFDYRHSKTKQILEAS
jgi:ligand-binding SRPBCC domain-containing protein